MSAVTIALALVIGASLGLVGGGGSILTVPALVHAGGFAPRDAIVASLIVVGVAAAAGAFLHWRVGTLDAAVAARFGGLGAVGAMGGARLGRLMPAAWLMTAFALIAVTAGLVLMSQRGFPEHAWRGRGRASSWYPLWVSGFSRVFSAWAGASSSCRRSCWCWACLWHVLSAPRSPSSRSIARRD